MIRSVLPWLGAILALASLYFFYRGVSFLATQEYVAALLSILVGFALTKTGVQLARTESTRGPAENTYEEGP